MARRRHYRGLVRFPGLGFLPKLPSSVKPTDVAVGMGLGLAGGYALKKGTEMAGIMIPDVIPTPILGGLASAAVLYMAQKRKNPSRASGQAVGAALGGLIVWGYGQLASRGMLGDIRTMPQGYGAALFNNPRLAGFNGPIFDNPSLNHARLAQMQGMGDDNEEGMFPAP
jgi:hypothetical protein